MVNYEQDNQIDCDVVIVGAGFSGIYGLHKFRQLGLKVQVFEAGGDLGGVWHWNRYPGARVDSEWPYYQLRIPEVWQDFHFSERFPGHEEVRRYFAHADKVLDLKRDIQFNARVNSAVWDEATSRWTVRTEAGHTAVCRYLCLFTGLLHRQYFPQFPGFESFEGDIYHSAAWPDGVDMTGKRIGVVGSGATGVQIVQELSKQAQNLTLFIRRPNICMPMGNRAIETTQHDAWRTYFPLLFDAGRKSSSGFPIPTPTQGMSELSDTARNEYYERMWNAGAFHFVGGNFPEVYTDKKANKIAYDFWAKKTRARMNDPIKRDMMAPLEPPYPIFTRRYPLERDYYESLDRENVDIVSLLDSPFDSFTETGVVTSDGQHHDLDVLVLATGFDPFSGSVSMMKIIGKDGMDLKDVWKTGIRTYLGILVRGFPNCFLSYSPQAPTVLSNGPTILECQIDFVAEAIAKIESEGLRSIEPTSQAEEAWRERIISMSRGTLFLENDSWWTGANIPGRQKEMLTYIGGIPSYEQECRATLDGWKGYDIRTGGRGSAIKTSSTTDSKPVTVDLQPTIA